MKTKLSIEGMSCDHCVRAVTEALQGLSGVTKAVVTLKTKSAEVEHDGALAVESLKKAVEEAGFSAA